MIDQGNQDISKISLAKSKQIDALLSYGIEKKAAIALWRLPKDKTQHVILDFDKGNAIDKLNIEDHNGFVFAPFDATREEKLILLKKDVYYNSRDGFLSGTHDKIVDASPLKESILATEDYIGNKNTSNSIQDEFSFVKTVNNAKDSILNGSIQKVVVSKRKNVVLNDLFDLKAFFDSLCTAYPNAFISLVAIPKVGIWIGASPETLVRQSGHKFETMALAGTRNGKDFQDVEDVSWKQKEIEEQAFVSRYIINCFKKIRLREFEEIGPKTVKAGNLFHLQTNFRVDTQATNFPQLATVMLELLHPTSAVCGMPLDKAKQFLNEEEKASRKYFSGYLGPVNITGETNIFVNLRCMELQGKLAVLYAGAGITASSDPEMEWLETEIKCNTVLDVVKEVERNNLNI